MFVNALSNILSTAAKNVSVRLEVEMMGLEGASGSYDVRCTVGCVTFVGCVAK